MADQTSQQSRPSANTYPSPHSYPSPSMQPSYTYPTPQPGSTQEPYRGSPQGPNVSLPSLNLPPLRLQDGQPQQPTPPQPAPSMGSPIPQPLHGMPQYYHAGPPPPGQMPLPSGSAQHIMRYQLPPHQGDQRILSGGRHKKEIKRRTKTGCLTCRRRRIKCDETHPVCNNCKKSKRDCLGYEPIFKQQPGPAQIQPAPNSAPHQASVPASSPPVNTSYAPHVPQGYAPAVSGGYVPPITSGGSNPPAQDSFHGPAIDPALAAADPAAQAGQPSYNGAHAANNMLRAMGSGSPYTPAPEPPIVKGKRLNIADLFAVGHHNPPEVPARQSPISQDLDHKFAEIFTNDYMLGLDAILETKWYSTNNNGLSRIMADKSLHEEAIFFVETVSFRSEGTDMAGIFSQEARLIWHMLSVCKHTSPATNGTNGVAPANAENEDVSIREVRARLDILEALLANQTLSANPLQQIAYPADVPPHKQAELDFWMALGSFVVYADSDAPLSNPADMALTTMRAVLQQQETRDALYSIAIARHLGNRVGGFPNHMPQPPDANPENNINKLNVATNFITYECRAGSQQVISRVCDMALLSWTTSRR